MSRSRCLARARGAIMPVTSPMTSAASTGSMRHSSFPASIRATSSASFSTAMMRCALAEIMRTWRICPALSGPGICSPSRSAKPTMAVMGDRSSWVMPARNWLLCSLAASAASCCCFTRSNKRARSMASDTCWATTCNRRTSCAENLCGSARYWFRDPAGLPSRNSGTQISARIPSPKPMCFHLAQSGWRAMSRTQ